MVGRILRALFYHYIKQRAKLTSKRPDNSSSTMSSQKPLTTEPQGTTIVTSSTDTSEKIIMETTTEDIVIEIRDWSIDRIHYLVDYNNHECEDSRAIYNEFKEWIDPMEDELNILSIER